MNHDIEKERWTRWDPAINGLEEIVYHITTFLDNKEGVTLTIVGWNRPPGAPTFRLFFKAPVIFYSKTGDSLCVISDNPPLIDYGPVAVDKWAFYKVTNSQQIARLKKSFFETEYNLPLQHFIIAEVESNTHIVTVEEPIATWIKHE